VILDRNEEVCLEARRHGVVLARPLAFAIVVAGVGGVLTTARWPLSAVGAVVVGVSALVALRAVWRWERTKLVVTTDKVVLLMGTWRRRAQAVRLGSVEAVEVDQTLAGRLLGYGTVVVGPLALDHVPKPRNVYRLVERLAG
jgi:uncharacterized membrane protein YdbT with pleckstrin-like domain